MIIFKEDFIMINILKEQIEDLESFIEIASMKRIKVYTIIAAKFMNPERKAIKVSELRELFGEYCRISDLIDEARVDIEDLELQIERLKNDKKSKSGIKECCILIR